MHYQKLSRMEVAACRDDLRTFIGRAWHIVEPGRRMDWSPWLDALCLHLMAVSRGDVLNMLVTFPPGTSKSRATCVYWTAWEWLRNPHSKWLFVGNNEEAATETSLECRRLIESPWYRLNFGIPWRIFDDENTKTNYKNSQGGHRIAFGIGSNVTGRKGDYIIVDDANDAEKVFQAAERKRVINRYDGAIWDRCLDFASARRVVVGQRTHVDDLIGHLQRQGGWFELRIPEEFDPRERFVSPIGWTDWRKKAGSLMRPDKFSRRMALDMRRNKLLVYQAKHLQQPRSKEGTRFKRAWFESHPWVYDTDNEHILLKEAGSNQVYRFHPYKTAIARFGTADGAASVKALADWTTMSSWAITERFDLVWLGCGHWQSEIPDQPELIHTEYKRFSLDYVAVEAVFANVALYQLAARTSMTVRPVSPLGADKLARAVPAMILAEAGKVWIPGPMTADLIGFPRDAVLDELTAFTGDPKQDDHDDIIDTFSYAARERAGLSPDNRSGTPSAVPLPTGQGINRGGEPTPRPAPRLIPTAPVPSTWYGKRPGQ